MDSEGRAGTEEQLRRELAEARRRIAELEKEAAVYGRVRTGGMEPAWAKTLGDGGTSGLSMDMTVPGVKDGDVPPGAGTTVYASDARLSILAEAVERLLQARDHQGDGAAFMESVAGQIRDLIQCLRSQKNLEAALAEAERARRILRALSRSSQVMMNSTDELTCLHEVCRIIVEDCGHIMAWVGYADDEEGKLIRPVAYAGHNDGYLERMGITWEDSERGEGPTGTAIRTGRPSICRDMLNDPAFRPWRAEAARRGYASSIALPIMVDGKAIGAINIYSGDTDPFSDDEVDLLTELANDLAAGLSAIRLRNAHEKALEELKVSLTKYKVLFDSFPLGISITDRDGNIIESSRESERLLGVSREDHMMRTIDGEEWRIIRPDGTDMPEHEFASVVALKDGCLVENVEMGIVKGNGDITWINVTAAPIPLEGYGVAITYGDITKRKKAETDLKVSENRYHELFSAMTEGFAVHEIICDEGGRPCDYRFLDVNPAFERMTGLRKEDVVGKTFRQILPGEDTVWIERYGPVALSGEPVHFDNYSSALKKYYEVFSYAPSPGQFATLFMDITDRKHAEEELGRRREDLEDLVRRRTTELEARNTQLKQEISQRKRAENALRLASAYNRSLLEASLDPLVTIDKHGMITDVNRATEKVTGRSREELVGTDFSGYFTEPHKARAGYRKVFSSGSVKDYLLEILHRDGHVTPVLYNAAVYHDQTGSVLGVFAAARDISKRQKAEEENLQLEKRLVQAQKIEALGKLAGGIAHDFNNVLQPIIINSELILDALPVHTVEREYLDQIIDAAQLGKDLIRQIKLFGSRKKTDLKPISLRPVVQDAINIWRRTLPAGIAFRQWISSSRVLVRTDPTQVQQIVLNLCTNAAQSMSSGGGFLGVSLRETKVTAQAPAFVSDLKPGRYLKLTVRDTGSGIDPEIRDRLFDPFFTTRKSSAGTGLGLAVVHEAIRNAGGSILVQSDVGKGTRFEVYFPIYEDAKVHHPLRGRASAKTGDRHVLLTDDNETELTSIRNLLAHLGYRVTCTTDPLQALEIFSHDPDGFMLLITDEVMPRLKGHELAQRIREIRDAVPIIVCSGSEDALDELGRSGAGIDGILAKPFTAAQLKEVIGRITG